MKWGGIERSTPSLAQGKGLVCLYGFVAYAFCLILSLACIDPGYVVGDDQIPRGDRTKCFLPYHKANLVVSRSEESTQTHQKLINLDRPDQSIRQAGVLPTEALGINDSATDGDQSWWRYLEAWKGLSSNGDIAIHRWLGLPLSDEVNISVRRGRTSPRFLPWRAGSFVVVQTPHFEILSRADTEASERVARDVERLYWVWTQMYFPLWFGRDQIQVAMGDWDPDSMKVTEYFSRKTSMRLSSRTRHRIVLLPDAQTYHLTVSSPQVAAGANAAITASEGFYSDTLATSFFYPREDLSSLAHEITHQLFEEATDRPRRTKTAATTTDFWLIEGIAGHFESFHPGRTMASIGGWDSNRLQYARYQTLIAGQPIADVSELAGNRAAVQRMPNLSRWYSQSILHTHHALDVGLQTGNRSSRAAILRRLAKVYHVDVTDFPSLNASVVEQSDPNPADVIRFLTVDDLTIENCPTHGDLISLCLAGCPVTDAGWSLIPSQKRIEWFDGSRTPITDEQAQRILSTGSNLRQLSLEATKVTPEIGAWMAGHRGLQELDVSWTSIDDAFIESLIDCNEIQTLWLTGTTITDASLNHLLKLPDLKTIDVQRTKITEAGRQRLKIAFPQLELDPLVLR